MGSLANRKMTVNGACGSAVKNAAPIYLQEGWGSVTVLLVGTGRVSL